MANALAITGPQETAPPAPRGVQWIDVATAAWRMGLDERSIRRRCGDQWFGRGLARQERPADGRLKPQWMVREDADPLLARVLFPDQIPVDVRHLATDQRRRAEAKAAVLAAFDRFATAGHGLTQRAVEAHFLKLLGDGRAGVSLAPGMRVPTDRTLRNWRAAFRRDGLAGLIDERGTRQRKPTGTDPFYADVKDRYLDLREPPLTACWEATCLIAQENGWLPRSFKQTQRFIATLPRPVVDKYRRGGKVHNDRSSRYIERDYSGLRSNEVWAADHHPFDVMVSHRGRHIRPHITAFQDMRSRKIVGWCISAGGGNTDTILTALGKAVDGHGLPERVYLDNGADFASYPLQGRTKRERRARPHLDLDPATVNGVFGGLQIAVTHCWPYHGQSKPIERFFRTMEDRFGRTMATYCGRSPAHKPQDLSAKLARGAAPTLDELADRFAAWLEGDYHARVHAGDSMDGRTPAEVFDACLTVKRVVPDEVRAVSLWKPSRPTAYTRAGVLCNGVGYGASASELYDWISRKVIVRVDPADGNRAAVCEVGGRFVCFVTANVRLPFATSAEELREGIAANRRQNKLPNEHRRRGPRIHRDVSAEVWARRAEEAARKRGAATPTSPVLSPVRTPLGDQLPALTRALNAAPPPQSFAKSIDLYGSDAPADHASPAASRRSLIDFMNAKFDEREAAEAADPFAKLTRFCYPEREAAGE